MASHAASNHRGRRHGGRLLAIIAVAAALCGGFLTGGAAAAEPAKCNTNTDKVCYAGYNAAGLRQIADDLSANGRGSRYYTAMETNLTNGVTGTVTLRDNTRLPFRLIGILHDDKADGSGRKAGLTFMAFRSLPKAYCMNGVMPSNGKDKVCSAGNSYAGGLPNLGGWRDSRLRQWMNKGEIWNTFPADFQNNVTTVLKQSGSMAYGNSTGAATSATADRLWVLSYRELVPTLYNGWKNSGGFQQLSQEGYQYEFFRTPKGMVSNNYSDNNSLANIYQTVSGTQPSGATLKQYTWAWERSSNPLYTHNSLFINSTGDPSGDNSATDWLLSVAPAFSF